MGPEVRSASPGLANTMRPKSENGRDNFFTAERRLHFILFLSRFEVN
jgi:hypothetical protein